MSVNGLTISTRPQDISVAKSGELTIERATVRR